MRKHKRKQLLYSWSENYFYYYLNKRTTKCYQQICHTCSICGLMLTSSVQTEDTRGKAFITNSSIYGINTICRVKVYFFWQHIWQWEDEQSGFCVCAFNTTHALRSHKMQPWSQTTVPLSLPHSNCVYILSFTLFVQSQWDALSSLKSE